MTLDELCKVVDNLSDNVPEQVADALDAVEIVCVETIADARLEMQRPEMADLIEDLKESDDDDPTDLPDDLKGAFVGAPLETSRDAEDGKDVSADEQDGDLPPEGIILMVAANIANEDEAASILMHEVGHALGLDEDAVDAIGLNEPAQPETGQPKPPEGGEKTDETAATNT